MIKRSKSEQKKPLANKAARKADAMELARLVYDIYKEEKASGKMKIGQNNAQHPNS